MTKIENGAFSASKLRTLIVDNCEIIEEEAFAGKINVSVQCGNLNFDNVKNCTKVEKIVSDE